MQPRSMPQTAEAGMYIEELFQMMFGMTAARPASYKDLTEQLNQFLLPHGINIKCCDVFEETLLKEAGVTTQPTKCIFAPAGDAAGKLMGFHFKGITYDDLLKFASYYNKHASQQSDVEMQFDKETNTGRMIVEVSVVYNKLLPAFKAAFPSISYEKLDQYNDLSEKDDDVVDYDLLQSILTLIHITQQISDNKLKAGMLMILHAQLQNRIEEYRKHQLHDCPEKSRSTMSLYSELDNFVQQSRAFPELYKDSNIESVVQSIAKYIEFQSMKKMKAFFSEAIVAATQKDVLSASEDSSTYAGSLDDASSAPESLSVISLSSSGSTSEASSSRGDSPLRSVARLFATPSTPSHSRSGSTASLRGSDTSTVLVSSSEFDIDSQDIFADEPDYVPLRSI